MSDEAPICLPPRPPTGPRTAARLPRGACDTHMHVFGPLAHYPVERTRSYTPVLASLDDYRAVMAALGIERAVLVQPSVYGIRNDAMIEALRAMPAHLRGVAVVGPDAADAELATLHAAGVRGIRVNRRNPGGLSLADAAPLARRIASLGWHIQLQIDLAATGDLAGLLEACAVPMVIDHFGFLDPRAGAGAPPFAALLRLMERGQLWMKLSAPYRVSRAGPPYADLTPFVEALLACRPDRLLWATDWPHTELFDRMPDDLDPSLLLGLDQADEATRQLVFVDNPARLYDFP